MTDTAPSPDAATPPVPVRPMPRLGHGLHWPDIVADIDRDEHARQENAETTTLADPPASASDETGDICQADSQSAPGHRNGCQGCGPAAEEGVIPVCWTAEDQAALFALMHPAFGTALVPPTGPPYVHRYLPTPEDEQPHPAYTVTVASAETEAEQIYAELREQTGGRPYLAPALAAARPSFARRLWAALTRRNAA